MAHTDKPVYTYDPDKKVIRQKATMEKPKRKDIEGPRRTRGEIRDINDIYYCKKRGYESHLASLKEYPADFPDSFVGRDLMEGKDFKFEERHVDADGNEAMVYTVGWVKTAIPIADKPGKGEVFNENTLRNEIIKIWGRYGAHIEVFDELLKKAFPIPSQQEAGQSSQSVSLTKDFFNNLNTTPKKFIGDIVSEIAYTQTAEEQGDDFANKVRILQQWLNESNQSVDETAAPSQLTEPLQQNIYRLEELVRSKNEEIERLKGFCKHKDRIIVDLKRRIKIILQESEARAKNIEKRLTQETAALKAAEINQEQVMELATLATDQEAEIERLKGLIEKTHLKAWMDFPEDEIESAKGMNWEKSWQQFKTDNNL